MLITVVSCIICSIGVWFAVTTLEYIAKRKEQAKKQKLLASLFKYPQSLDVNSLCLFAHHTASKKGFWDKEKEIGTVLMLIVSELGEACEAHRKGKRTVWDNYFDEYARLQESSKEVTTKELATFEQQAFTQAFQKHIKDTFEDELADTFIRLGDLCGKLGIDIDTHIRLKMRYNETRPRLHGKKY